MNTTLFKREIKANWKIILLFMLVLSFYSSIIVAMFDPKLGESLEMMAKSMPELFNAFGMSSPGSTLLEFVGNYLYGFILVAFPIIFIVLLVNRLIVRYVDRGSMAYLLSTPNKRVNIILTQLFMLVFGLLLLVCYVTIFVIICGNLMFDEGIEISTFLILNVGLCLLLLFFVGVNFLSACIFQETKKATGIGAGISIFFLLVQMLSQAGDSIDWLQYATPMTLFQPNAIIAQEPYLASYMALGIMALVMFVVGVIVFKRKDLSL